jgi:hypothetical protein
VGAVGEVAIEPEELLGINTKDVHVLTTSAAWANNWECGMSNRFRKAVRNSVGDIIKASALGTASSHARVYRLFPPW